MKTKIGHFPANNPNPVLSVEKYGTIIYSNEAGEHLLNEWGTKIGEKVPSHIGNFVQKVISQSIQGKMEVKAGSRIYLLAFHPLSDDECVNIYGFDISGQKKPEEELKESKEQYRMLFDHSMDGIILTDPRDGGKILSVNPAVCQMFGWTEEELIGKGRDAIFDTQEPSLSSLLSERARSGAARAQLNYRRKDGTTFPGEVSTALFTDNNGEPRAVAIIRDITERKQAEETVKESEEKYRSLFNNMSEGFGLHEIILDAEGKPCDYRFLELNEAFEKLTGISREKALGRKVTEVLPDIESYWIETYGRVALTGEAIRYENYTAPIGRWYDIYSYSPRKNQFAVMFVDITERKQEEHRILRYNRILEGINRIFSKVVNAKTEEELGNACLSVALEVTGGGIGFVNLLGDDGLMHDIAISEGGWDQCLMYDKTGHRRPPGNFVVHGLYGHVVTSGKGFFTNDPPSHPQRIGLPPNHPPLTSFLGVPLIQNGKAVGMLGVANREGGYCCEQLEDLEAIAPAVMQALKRKREEQERMQAEKEVAEQARLLNLSYDAILIRDAKDRITYWNVGAQEVYGYTKEEAIGHSPHELLKTEFPQPLEEIFGILYRDSRWMGELIHTRKDGRKITVITRWVLDQDLKGNSNLILEANSDITERKRTEDALKEAYEEIQAQSEELQVQNEELQAQSEELHEANEALHESDDQFRALVNNVKSGVALVDETGRFMVINPSFMKMFDLDDELDILNINSHDWSRWEVYGEDGKLLHVDNHPVRKVVMTGSPVKDQLVAVRNPGANELTWMLISAEPILKEDGHIYRVICTYHDITKRKKAEDKLKETLDNLDKLVKERTEELEKAYNSLKEIETARKQEIHHRIKNNLQVISSLLDLQAEKFKDREFIEDLEVLEAFKESQDRVISMALIHEELYKGGGLETLNFSSYIQELADNLLQTYRIGNTNISLKLNLEENIYFNMDIAVPLGMIVNEIVTNSLKHAFSGRNEGEICIKLLRDENGQFIKGINEDCISTNFTLTVSDNGVGIPENLDIENLDSLGLQLIISLVDQLNGQLKLKGDTGTEFIIRFTMPE